MRSHEATTDEKPIGRERCLDCPYILREHYGTGADKCAECCWMEQQEGDVTDIVERLRGGLPWLNAGEFGWNIDDGALREILDEAANEIERLRAEKTELLEALMDAGAHLIGAASAYQRHAARHRSVGRAKADPFFSTRATDFTKAAERARLAIAGAEGKRLRRLALDELTRESQEMGLYDAPAQDPAQGIKNDGDH